MYFFFSNAKETKEIVLAAGTVMKLKEKSQKMALMIARNPNLRFQNQKKTIKAYSIQVLLKMKFPSNNLLSESVEEVRDPPEPPANSEEVDSPPLEPRTTAETSTTRAPPTPDPRFGVDAFAKNKHEDL